MFQNYGHMINEEIQYEASFALPPALTYPALKHQWNTMYHLYLRRLVRLTPVRSLGSQLTLLLTCLLLVIVGLLYQSHTEKEPLHEQEGPMVYEYYSEGGVNSALKENGGEFELNGKMLHILSGSIHYFRVPEKYWRDRLRKLRAAGFNTVTTYVAWNLHEKLPEQFDFKGILDVKRFIEIAKEEDLLVILRPGPYICSEFEFGGLPAWLLADSGMKVRQSYAGYEIRVKIYLKTLLTQLRHLQWSQEYGAQPIIMMQVENEYGSLFKDDEPDKKHLEFLLKEMKSLMNHVMYVTSDSLAMYGTNGAVEGALMTVNFGSNGTREFEALQKYQPGRPKMVMEFWTGWFDHWTEQHHTKPVAKFATSITNILKHNASMNLYMFHGGTTFGFYTGANPSTKFGGYIPTVNSYDYDAPLTESGDYTEKYFAVKNLIKLYNRGPTFNLPLKPPESLKKKYRSANVQYYKTFDELLQESVSESSDEVLNMESLPFYKGHHGFIVYSQTDLKLSKLTSILEIKGYIRDIAYVVLDGELISKPIKDSSGLEDSGFWITRKSSWTLKDTGGSHKLDILVETMGRKNFGGIEHYNQKKGLWEVTITMNDEPLSNWKITTMEFKKDWMYKLQGWKGGKAGQRGPVLIKSKFVIEDDPQDTWIDLRAEGEDVWLKGVVWVNGVNLGRYWNVGPTRTMYLPAPLLNKGFNEIIIFELYQSGTVITFSDVPIL